MRALQRGVALVLRVPVAVVRQRGELVQAHPLRRHVRAAGQPPARVVLVDVVAEVQHHVEVLGGQPVVRGPVAVLPVLAVDHPDAQPHRVRPRRRGGAGASDRADQPAGAEAVGVLPAGLQAAHVDVHRVRPLRPGERDAAADRVPEGRVGRHLPLHRDRAGRHRARVVRVADQPGPQHHGVRERVAAGDAEPERAVRVGLGGRRGRARRHPQRHSSGHRRRAGQEPAPVHGHAVQSAHRYPLGPLRVEPDQSPPEAGVPVVTGGEIPRGERS